MPPIHLSRNPADLVGLDRDPALARLMRACGIGQAYITGGASDYDRFAALAAALPLCVGHPLHGAVTDRLQAATGLTVPLAASTTRIYWDAWVDRHWYGRDDRTAITDVEAYFVGKDEPPAPSVWLTPASLTALPDPTDSAAWRGEVTDLSSWTAWLEAAVGAESSGDRVLDLTLPEGFAFVRPDPYHADQAVRRRAAGERSVGDLCLLTAQAVRVVGRMAAARGSTVVLRGGSSEAVTALLAYLEGCRCLPDTVWVPCDPTAAGAVSGLYAAVCTGVLLSSADTPTAVSDRLTAYARVAPVGRAVLLTDTDTPNALREAVRHTLLTLTTRKGDRL